MEESIERKFVKYTEIENSYREKMVALIPKETKESGWYITEKLHGQNCSIQVNENIDNNARICTRNQIIDSPPLYIQHIMEKYVLIVEDIIEKYDDIKQLRVYGEMFGGYYPETKKDDSAKRIQKGVNYCNENKFMIYDIKLNEEYIDAEQLFDISCEFYKQYPEFKDFEKVPVVATVDNLNQALEYNIEIDSVIPSIYNMPSINDNIIEGVVIKPVKEFRDRFGNRVILKMKNEKFKEKIKKENKEPREYPEEIKKYINNIQDYLNENRANALFSKYSELNNDNLEIDKKLIGQLFTKFSEDVNNDFLKDNDISQLDDESKKILSKLINKQASSFIRPLILKNI